MSELEEIRAEIERVSGTGKRLAPGLRRHGIYSTMTLPGLDDMEATRDTKTRFSEFGVEDDLTGLTWIDVGSNAGATALEAARRGARVVGVEFRQDRVDLCNRIATRWELDAQFHQADLDLVGSESEEWRATRYDRVWCSAVDRYVTDPDALYHLLRRLCADGGSLYLESNLNRTGMRLEEATIRLTDAGFSEVTWLGFGDCRFVRRRIYLAR